jgi:hypothetical protein
MQMSQFIYQSLFLAPWRRKEIVDMVIIPRTFIMFQKK